MRRNIILFLFILFVIVLFSFTKQKLFLVETIETTMSPNDLWNLVTVSIENPQATTLWPREYEEIQSTRLVTGNTIYTTYKTPFGSSKQEYIISEARYGVLEYTTGKNHPLKGNSIITVIPRPEGSALSWSINYTYSTLNPIGWYVRYLFAPAFFSSLKSNLKQIKNSLYGV